MRARCECRASSIAASSCALDAASVHELAASKTAEPQNLKGLGDSEQDFKGLNGSKQGAQLSGSASMRQRRPVQILSSSASSASNAASVPEFIDELLQDYRSACIHKALIDGAFKSPPDEDCRIALHESISQGVATSSIFPPGLIGPNLEENELDADHNHLHSELTDQPARVIIKHSMYKKVQSDKIAEMERCIRSSKFVDRHGIDETKISKVISSHKLSRNEASRNRAFLISELRLAKGSPLSPL